MLSVGVWLSADEIKQVARQKPLLNARMPFASSTKWLTTNLVHASSLQKVHACSYKSEDGHYGYAQTQTHSF